MPFGVDPETLLIVAFVGGIGAAATYTTFHQAEKAGPKLKKVLKQANKLVAHAPSELLGFLSSLKEE